MIPRPSPPQERPPDKFPKERPITPDDLDHPTLRTLFKLLYNTVVKLFHEPVGMVIGSSFALLMLWGYHGQLEVLSLVWPDWKGPGSPAAGRPQILPGVPWDQEWISFAIGAVLLVGVPTILIKRVFKQKLSAYGLGLPRENRWQLALLSAAVLALGSFPAFVLATRDKGMQDTYPLYHGSFESLGQFAVYEAGYFVFFVVIEFIFRGYLLFGLFHAGADMSDGLGKSDRLAVSYYAITLSMLSYTAWHLGKPVPELWGTLVWGLAAGTVVLATGTIWHVVLIHWALNVFLDYRLWQMR